MTVRIEETDPPQRRGIAMQFADAVVKAAQPGQWYRLSEPVKSRTIAASAKAYAEAHGVTLRVVMVEGTLWLKGVLNNRPEGRQ